jgi:hypothetical protein
MPGWLTGFEGAFAIKLGLCLLLGTIPRILHFRAWADSKHDE